MEPEENIDNEDAENKGFFQVCILRHIFNQFSILNFEAPSSASSQCINKHRFNSELYKCLFSALPLKTYLNAEDSPKLQSAVSLLAPILL